MVSREQVMKGILKYIDNEVIPYLPTAGKLCVGSITYIATSKIEKMIIGLTKNPIVTTLEIIDENGMIDVELISAALIENFGKYGNLDASIPFIGEMAFNSKDVEMLKEYIIGGC